MNKSKPSNDNATQEELSLIIEKATKLKIPPLFFDLLLSKLHTLQKIDVKLLLDCFNKLQNSEQSYSDKIKDFNNFWKDLEEKIDLRLQEKAKDLKNEFIKKLTQDELG